MEPILIESLLSFPFHIMLNQQLSKQSIRWPASYDHIGGSGVEVIKDHWSNETFPLDRKLWYFQQNKV